MENLQREPLERGRVCCSSPSSSGSARPPPAQIGEPGLTLTAFNFQRSSTSLKREINLQIHITKIFKGNHGMDLLWVIVSLWNKYFRPSSSNLWLSNQRDGPISDKKAQIKHYAFSDFVRKICYPYELWTIFSVCQLGLICLTLWMIVGSH